MMNSFKVIFLILLLWMHIHAFPQPATTPQLSDSSASRRVTLAYSNLCRMSEQGIMFGHQDDLAYGIGWIAPEKPSDIFSILGDYPAVFGWDLGDLETGVAFNLDSVPFKSMKDFALRVHEMGGINTFSWHLNNPLTSGDAWDVSANGVVSAILPGESKHSLYCSWLDKVADFLGSLVDKQGNQIPVMFRPFHEQSGNWFWWGKEHCSADEFKQLWQFTFHYLTSERNLHNLVFVFSPADNFDNSNEYLDRYPGDAYVDLLGFDIYQGDATGNEKFADLLDRKLNILCAIGRTRNKPVAITEIGYERIPYDKWWTEVLWPVIGNYPLTYALLWRNAANRPDHFYAPYPGQKSEQDFITLFNLERTLFLNDIHGKIY